MFALKMCYKCLIATGFHSHHFKTFLKCFLLDILKAFQRKHFIHIYSDYLLNVYLQTFPNKVVGEQ